MLKKSEKGFIGFGRLRCRPRDPPVASASSQTHSTHLRPKKSRSEEILQAKVGKTGRLTGLLSPSLSKGLRNANDQLDQIQKSLEATLKFALKGEGSDDRLQAYLETKRASFPLPPWLLGSQSFDCDGCAQEILLPLR